MTSKQDPGPSIVWFRQDLRLEDHPALSAALRRGGPVLSVFVWAPEEEEGWAPGGASRVWLQDSLAALSSELEARGSRLIVRTGPSAEVLRDLAGESGAQAVFWNRRYEPAVIARDTAIKKGLRADGLIAESFNAGLLFEPWTIQNKSGRPFQVFTPYWKTCLAQDAPPDPLTAPDSIPAPKRWPKSLPLSKLHLEPRIDWAGGLRATWRPGEAGARAAFDSFLKRGLESYSEDRDRPYVEGMSSLSPHLHFGELSPRSIWHAVRRRQKRTRSQAVAAEGDAYLRQLGWREFAHHLLFHFADTPAQPLRRDFADFPWREDAVALRAWQQGRTGYPLVDAGMRQLWETGWMHNRVRMVVASFLVKHLLLPWQAGAEWFWDTLVDADLANNTMGWQWAAGCGADAAPYFRIFNPVRQGERFDPEGAYVRRWVPELSRLEQKWVHKPWEAPPPVLAQAGVELGKTYPQPVVDHGFARQRALEALAEMRG